MGFYHLKWSVVITHIPTGMVVERTSEFFRNQHQARDSAMRYLRSRLYNMSLGFNPSEVEVRHYNVPDNDLFPRDLMKYAEEGKIDNIKF